MKRFESQVRLGGLLKGLVALALSVGAGQAAAQATQGILASRHNLSTSNQFADGNRVTGAGATAEVCVFCHTPHAAAPAPAGTEQPPLWNKRLQSGATYTLYNTAVSSTIQGAVLPVGSISVACLSCHDGTQAMDNIVNAPGSGGLIADGGAAAGRTGAAWTWATNTPARVTAEGALLGVANMGTDLRDDHPIGVQFAGGGYSVATPAGPGVDADFRAATTATINGSQVWWVNTGAGQTASREKGDIWLYSRNFGSVATPNVGPSVECGSCHDPHVTPGQDVDGAAGTRVAGATFLRVSNDGSAVCLACHNK